MASKRIKIGFDMDPNGFVKGSRVVHNVLREMKKSSSEQVRVYSAAIQRLMKENNLTAAQLERIENRRQRDHAREIARIKRESDRKLAALRQQQHATAVHAQKVAQIQAKADAAAYAANVRHQNAMQQLQAKTAAAAARQAQIQATNVARQQGAIQAAQIRQANAQVQRAQYRMSQAGIDNRIQQLLGNALHALGNIRHGASAFDTALTDQMVRSRDSFMSLQDSEVNLRVLMKAFGPGSDPANVSMFDAARDQARAMSSTTGLTESQLLTQQAELLKGGVSSADLPSALRSSYQFYRASGGEVDMKDAAVMLLAASKQMGTSFEETADMMFEVANTTALSLAELPALFRGFRGGSAFMPNTPGEDWAALTGILRDNGTSARMTGTTLTGMAKGMGRSIQYLNETGVIQGTGASRQFIDAVNKIGWSLNDFTDINSEGVRVTKSALDIYVNLADKIAAYENRTGDYLGSQNIVQAILGQANTAQGFMNLVKYRRQGGDAREYAQQIAGAQGTAERSTSARETTLSVQQEIMKANIDRLRAVMFSPLEGDYLAGLSAINSIVKSIELTVDKDGPIGKGMSQLALSALVMSKAFLAAMTVLTSMFSFLLAGQGIEYLKESSLLKGKGLFSATMGSGKEVFALIRGPMMFAAALTAAFFAVRKAYNDNLGGFRDDFDALSTQVSAMLDVFIPLLSGESVSQERWDKLSTRTKNIFLGIYSAVKIVGALFEGIASVVIPAIGYGIVGVAWFIKNMIIPVMEFFGVAVNKTGPELEQVFRFIGKIIGVGLMLWAIKSAWGVVQMAGSFIVLAKKITLAELRFASLLILSLLTAAAFTHFGNKAAEAFKEGEYLKGTLYALGQVAAGVLTVLLLMTSLLGGANTLAALNGVGKGISYVAGMAVTATAGISLMTAAVAGLILVLGALAAYMAVKWKVGEGLADIFAGPRMQVDEHGNNPMLRGAGVGWAAYNPIPMSEAGKYVSGTMEASALKEELSITGPERTRELSRRIPGTNWSRVETSGGNWQPSGPPGTPNTINVTLTGISTVDDIVNAFRDKLTSEYSAQGYIMGAN